MSWERGKKELQRATLSRHGWVEVYKLGTGATRLRKTCSVTIKRRRFRRRARRPRRSRHGALDSFFLRSAISGGLAHITS